MIIFINGPARSGKDTAANIIRRSLNGVVEVKVSSPLKASISKMFSLSYEQERLVEEHKDAPGAMFFGMSYRDVQIKLFEEFFKPVFGDDVLGKLCVNKLKGLAGPRFVISDCGRQEEFEAIVSGMGNSRNMYLLRLERPDHTFDGDCRHYVEPIREVNFQTINNQFDLEMFEAQVKRALVKWDLLKDN